MYKCRYELHIKRGYRYFICNTIYSTRDSITLPHIHYIKLQQHYNAQYDLCITWEYIVAHNLKCTYKNTRFLIQKYVLYLLHTCTHTSDFSVNVPERKVSGDIQRRGNLSFIADTYSSVFLARPKSAIFSTLLSLTRIFLHAKSRCRTPKEDRYCCI